MRHMPKVSVIIPTYNRASLIQRAIDSVLTQTYTDFELIVVDDASNDNTQAVLEKIRDTRIRLMRHNLNMGGSAARNTGIRAAKGDFIGLLDDDDEWLPNKLGKQLDLFNTSSNNLGLVYSGFFFISLKNNSILNKLIPEKKGFLFHELLRRNLIGSATPLIRKVCFDNAGYFDVTLQACQDWEMWIRISRYYSFDFIPEPLAKSYVHGAQVSTNLNIKIRAREKLVKKYHNDLINIPSTLSFLMKRLGILYCIARNRYKGLYYFFKSIRWYPGQKDCYRHILLCIFFPAKHRALLNRDYVSHKDGIIFYF